MTDIVFAHDGTVAKIVGDALHVLFGAPGEQPDHAARAVTCALALDEYAQSFRERWRKKGSRWESPASAFMPGRRSSAISAAAGSSTTRPMAIPSTSRRGWKPPTSNSAPAYASAQRSRRRWRIFAAGRSATLCCGAGREALRAFEPLQRRAIRRSRDQKLSGGICQTGSQRSWRDGGLCGACRQIRRRSARQLPSQAAVERRDRHADRDGIGRHEGSYISLLAPSVVCCETAKGWSWE